MNKSLDNKLTTSFPLLYADRNGCKTKTAMCYGFACGDGWFNLIWSLSKKLESIIEKIDCPIENQPKAVQVKEKFGSLRFYMINQTDDMISLIKEAERKSKYICSRCGSDKDPHSTCDCKNFI